MNEKEIVKLADSLDWGGRLDEMSGSNHPDDLELMVFADARHVDEKEKRRIAGRLNKIKTHLEGCEKCSGRLNEIEAKQLADDLGLPGALESEEYDQRNRWAKQLGASTMDAGKLLDIMRPEVEKILVLSGHTSPPSQSMRASACAGELQCKYRELLEAYDGVMDQTLNIKQRLEIMKARDVLEDFLAVHRTVCILEGKP